MILNIIKIPPDSPGRFAETFLIRGLGFLNSRPYSNGHSPLFRILAAIGKKQSMAREALS